MLEFFGKTEDEKVRELANTDGILGPKERQLRSRAALLNGSLGNAAGREEFRRAEREFQQKNYSVAEDMAKNIVKKHEGSPVREDALFLLGEAQFAQGKYPAAVDSYEQLVKDFPATRYQKTRNQRLFAIAKHWLKDPQYITTDDVKLASHQENAGKSSLRINPEKQPRRIWTDPTRTIPILPNFVDRSRPVFDTEGRALQALKSIWVNDPTGPLADDALMLTASYYVRKRDFVEADHIYDILREEYPKSPHTKNAIHLGSFVKMASYQGPEYDDKVLNSAQELKKTSLRLYPNDPMNDRIRDELRRIQELKAAADWEYVTHYQKKGKPRAVAVYCREIIRLYPTTSYADRARQLLLAMNAQTKPAPKPAPVREEPKEPGAPRRLFSLPKFAIPALPKFRFSKPKTLDSRSDSEKEPVGRVRI
ncbi:MAG: hypothetical protein Tsb009_36530 [Planctomycetaceae bacterium]